MTSPTIEVIIPVRDMADHLPKLVAPLLEQSEVGDRVTIVDDASVDDTDTVARSFGAHVITLAQSRGPYYARQVAASRSTADVLVFIDGRCRPLPGPARSAPLTAAATCSRTVLHQCSHLVGSDHRCPDGGQDATIHVAPRRWRHEGCYRDGSSAS